ncbi:sensor histidine kinase [Saccharospirillum impatiens]|uniref:sensor histidine kinase n=1 Tax=Saccharospirillum impatiens TaxID=169438 RepID=UPI00055C0A55|nr:ATP-binding protein [Saccharospirillum impatiens]
MTGISLSLRIVLLVLITTGALTVGMLATVYPFMVSDYENLVAERESAEIERLASELDLSLSQRQLTLEVFSTRLVGDDDQLLDRENLQLMIERPSIARESFPDGLLVLGPTATAIAENVYVPGRLGTNYSDRSHFKRAIESEKAVISAPILGRTTGLPLLSFLQPILSTNDEVLGFVSGVLDLSTAPLLPDQSASESESNTFTLIIDPQYRLYVSMREQFNTPKPLPAAGTDSMVDAAVAVSPAGTLVDYQNQQYLIASKQLDTLGWVVLRAIPYREAIAPATVSYRWFLVISLVALALVSLCGWCVARSLMRPIESITQRIDRMADDARMDSDFPEQGSPEVRALARAMNKLVRERKALEQLKDDFISSVSHELRTPLTSLHGSLKLLHAGVIDGIPERAKGLIVLSLRNSERLQALISDFLDFSRLMTGKFDLHPNPCQLYALAEQATADIAHFADSNVVGFRIDIPGDALVQADEQRLRQVLDNLLSNAIKHSPENGLVTLTAKPTSTGGWRLTVSDQGEGVPDEFLPRIFERFSQADHGNKRAVTGTGLGLSISRELMLIMGGDIGFYNDTGAHFWFEMPGVGSVGKD